MKIPSNQQKIIKPIIKKKMEKYALLIGCNYTKTPQYRLNGCIYDVVEMKKILIDVFKYNENNIILLSDDTTDPNTDNIINNLIKLVKLSNNAGEIYLHYSGHGTQVVDKSNDETDGKDEGICPTDFPTKGILTDDLMYNLFFSKVNPNCRVICVFDSCSSASVSDLENSWLYNGNKLIKTTMTKRKPLNKRIYVLSGCLDNLYSYETTDKDTGKNCGALSYYLRKVLQENNWILSIDTLLTHLRNKLTLNKIQQNPVLTVGFICDKNELVFVNPKP